MWEAGEGGPGVPSRGIRGLYFSPDDRISVTLKGSSIYAAIFAALSDVIEPCILVRETGTPSPK